MTTPRTIAGQAALSALRPHVRRALSHTVLAIEAEAAAPYREALEEADRLLAELAGKDPAAGWDKSSRAALVTRAEAAHGRVRALLAQEGPEQG